MHLDVNLPASDIPACTARTGEALVVQKQTIQQHRRSVKSNRSTTTMLQWNSSSEGPTRLLNDDSISPHALERTNSTSWNSTAKPATEAGPQASSESRMQLSVRSWLLRAVALGLTRVLDSARQTNTCPLRSGSVTRPPLGRRCLQHATISAEQATCCVSRLDHIRRRRWRRRAWAAAISRC